MLVCSSWCLYFLSQTCTDASGPHAWFLFPSTWLRPYQPLLGLLASPTPPGPPIMMFTLSLLLQTYLHIRLCGGKHFLDSCLMFDSFICRRSCAWATSWLILLFTAVHVPEQLNLFYKGTASCPHTTNASNMYPPPRPLSLPASILRLFQGFRNLFLNVLSQALQLPTVPFPTACIDVLLLISQPLLLSITVS